MASTRTVDKPPIHQYPGEILIIRNSGPRTILEGLTFNIEFKLLIAGLHEGFAE